MNRLYLTEIAAELMVYFERHKLREILSRLLSDLCLFRPKNVRLWLGFNIKRIANDIYTNCLECNKMLTKEVEFYKPPGSYLLRVVLFGRRGSGRKTQAHALAKTFRLIYIDVEQLIYAALQNRTCALSKAVQESFGGNDLVAKMASVIDLLTNRLLEMDCLRHGWVIVNFPHNLCECRALFEDFTIPPNKLVYLQCSEEVARLRLSNMPPICSPSNAVAYWHKEQEYFNKHEQQMTNYLANRYETSFVNAKDSFDVVNKKVVKAVMQQAYIMGTKY